MRKLIVFNMISVDGFFAGENDDISWHQVDAEFNEFAINQLQNAGALLFGRKTYELMAGYWPSPARLQDDPVVAGHMNSISKLVFSKSLSQADWENTTLMRAIDAVEITKLKNEPGKDMYIFGSGTIVQQCTQLGLIDEYRFMINPVALGSGKKMFDKQQNLRFIKSKEFKNGNLLVYYQPSQ